MNQMVGNWPASASGKAAHERLTLVSRPNPNVASNCRARVGITHNWPNRMVGHVEGSAMALYRITSEMLH